MSPHATNVTINHLREHIRTRSSRATRREAGQTKTLSTIRVLRKSATIQEFRKSPHRASLLPIPPRVPQVNLDRPIAYSKWDEMHRACRAVARGVLRCASRFPDVTIALYQDSPAPRARVAVRVARTPHLRREPLPLLEISRQRSQCGPASARCLPPGAEKSDFAGIRR